MSRYRAGLASAPIAGFMVMYNKHTLNLEDLATLEEQNWLNDQVNAIINVKAANEKPFDLLNILIYWFKSWTQGKKIKCVDLCNALQPFHSFL